MRFFNMTKSVFCYLVFMYIFSQLIFPNSTSAEIKLWKAQTVYVPVYSLIFVGEREMPFQLSTNLCIRNTDPVNSIIVTMVNYYNSEGKPIKEFLDKPMLIAPLASEYSFVKASDKTGGHGANFLVKWKSSKPVNMPLIQCVMSGMRGNHSISFIVDSQIIKDPAKKNKSEK